jgi:hypothetical protein
MVQIYGSYETLFDLNKEGHRQNGNMPVITKRMVYQCNYTALIGKKMEDLVKMCADILRT